MASNTTPAWWREYATSWTAGEAHAFLLYGDISGYAHEGVSQRRYLMGALSTNTRSVVAIYNRASGITFAAESMREKALALIGSSPSASQQSGGNVFGAALAGLGPQNSQQDPFASARQVGPALSLLEQLLTAEAGRGKVAVILDYADLIIPPFAKATASPDNLNILAQFLSWAISPQLAQCNNPIFLLSSRLADIHEDIRASGSGWKAIEISMPDYETRLTYLQWYIAQRDAARAEATAKRKTPPPAITCVDLDVAECGRLTAGLNLRHIEDILLLAAKSDGVTRALVKARKDAIITSEYSEVAEMIEPLPGGFRAIGGVDHLIAWAQDEIIRPVRDGHPTDAPKGVLFVGPPGTGKTFLTRALAAEVGYNAVALNLSNILGGIVGESEQRLQRFFTFARSLAPVLVFVDEIDQSDVSRRGNGSGNPVAANLFNAMLQFMSDETLRGKVIVIFASNRPDLIDPALLRFGRMDAIIPVLLPDESARCGIIAAQARMQGAAIAPDAIAQLAAQTENYSAADLAALVAKSRKLARRAGCETVALEQVTQALTLIRPATATSNQAEWYTLQAVSACNDAEYLPPKYAALLANRQDLSTQIRQQAPDFVRRERAL
jgi:transitional endoplasmic reticulum ATPase